MSVKTLCPCCRREVEGALPREQLVGLFTSPQHQKLIQRLARRAGSIVTREELVDALWSDCIDGGPENTNAVLHTLKYNTQAILSRAGWIINTFNGRGFSLEIAERK